ncbi:MAG: putative DNA modification/repair radical SAM protein [Steroidobacteraceae bacterium]
MFEIPLTAPLSGPLDLRDKLALLADAAKYDASCASSGTTKRDSRSGGLGSAGGMGICHSYAPDGRCISLLKVLLTNYCEFDCQFCINRKSSNVRRARFTADELADLTLDFYRRNYIEGLFLSSGIVKSSDYTMEQLVLVARKLRVDHGFRGYIHLKTIPDAAPELLQQAGLYADRLSINVELPTQTSLVRLAPEKNLVRIKGAMDVIRAEIAEKKDDAKRLKSTPKFAPAGQSTQMIVGADDTSDAVVLRRSDGLYREQSLRRVYYSAYSPIPDSSRVLPQVAAPLLREHRLYQADWLLRFYGFTLDDLLDATTDDMLSLDHDPKLAWALRHPDRFPLDLNRAPRERLLRVPGLGVRSVDRIVRMRRLQKLRLEHLNGVVPSVRRVKPFIQLLDWHPRRESETAPIVVPSAAEAAQLSLAL